MSTRGDPPAALGQPDGVGALAAADVQRRARRRARRPRRPAAGWGGRSRPVGRAGSAPPRTPASNIVLIAGSPVAATARRASSATRSALIAAPAPSGRPRRTPTTCARHVGDVARHPHARARRWRRSGRPGRRCRRRTVASPARPPRGPSASSTPARAMNRGATTTRRAATTSPEASRTPVSRSSVDLQPGDLAVDHGDARARRAARPPPSASAGPVCRKKRHVVAQLPEQQRLVHGQRPGGEDADRLVADLPAVAVRAVQHVAAPALGQPGHVGQLVDQPGGDQQPAGPHRAGRRRASPEAAVVLAPRRRSTRPATTSPP